MKSFRFWPSTLGFGSAALSKIMLTNLTASMVQVMQGLYRIHAFHLTRKGYLGETFGVHDS